MKYGEFIAGKAAALPPVGFDPIDISGRLFPFQSDIVAWACRRGRAAIFADCGLGKTPMQLEWARQVASHSGGRVLILAPLAVAHQTIREGAKFGIDVAYARDASEIGDARLTVTNYERLDGFDPSEFSGIVLDESSILKSFDGKTRTQIIQSFKGTPYRLACTATPAPNDFMELGNHAEFLDAMTRAEMLAMFFVHDGGSTQDWRIKGHAEDSFWRWICQWAVMIRKPSDLGYEDGGFKLPPLHLRERIVPVDEQVTRAIGLLFRPDALTLDEQRAARRETIGRRVAEVADLVNASGDPWIVWCELNAEGDALESAIPGAVQVAGSDSDESKEAALIGFADGRVRVLITKPSIGGWGMNWQHCANVAFVGLSHSYEKFYQAVRRCWRFGQRSEVNCHIVIAETEGRILANIQRKEADATRMADAMAVHMKDIQNTNVRRTERDLVVYSPSRSMTIPRWLREYAASVEDAT